MLSCPDKVVEMYEKVFGPVKNNQLIQLNYKNKTLNSIEVVDNTTKKWETRKTVHKVSLSELLFEYMIQNHK